VFSADQRFDDKSFPARSNDRVPQDLVERSDLEKRIHQPAVAPIDLRRTDKALAEIAALGRLAADQHEIDQEVDIAVDHRRRHADPLRQPSREKNLFEDNNRAPTPSSA